MANGSFNVSLGRETEFHNRVNNNDPTDAVYLMVILAASGLELDAVLQDCDTLSEVLDGTTSEVTNTGYSRKVISDAELAAYAVNHNDNEIRLPLANQTFASISAGDSWRKLLICYDSVSTTGGDDDIIPVKFFDVLSIVTGQAIVPNGGDIVFSFPDGYHVAT